MLWWDLFQIPTGPHSTMRRTSQWQERQGRTLFFILRSSTHSMLHETFSHYELWLQNLSGSLSNHLSSKHGFSGVPHWGGGYLCFFQVLTKLFWTVIDFITKPLCAVIVLIYLIWSYPSSEAFEYEEENNMEDEEWFYEESCLPNFAFNQLNKYS